MHRHGQSGRGRNDPQHREHEHDDAAESRGRDPRVSSHAEPGRRSQWIDDDHQHRMGQRDEGMQGQNFDEGRRFAGRGPYDRDREYTDRGGQGGYGGYGRDMGSQQDRGDDQRRAFERGGGGAQDYGSRSIGFRGRIGEDYGYGGFGHMGQSDMRVRGTPGMERYMDRGHGGGEHTMSERYGQEHYGQERYGQERSMSDRYGQGQERYGERSQGLQAPMRGKGPKNYTRSDERIREDVCELLEDADLDATEIDVKVNAGEVVLEGTVGDRWAKREAEDVVSQARGVKDCHNQLKVRASDQSQRTQGMQSQQTQSRGNNGSATTAQTKSNESGRAT